MPTLRHKSAPARSVGISRFLFPLRCLRVWYQRAWSLGFIRVGAVGIRIRKTPLRFPNSWAGGKPRLRAENGRRKNFTSALTRARALLRPQPVIRGEINSGLRLSGLLGSDSGKAPRKYLGDAELPGMPGNVQRRMPANLRSQIRLRSDDKRLRWFLYRWRQ